MPTKGPLLCQSFWAPDLISSIQLFNHIIKEAVVAVGTVWVTAAEQERGVGDMRSERWGRQIMRVLRAMQELWLLLQVKWSVLGSLEPE